MGPIIVGILVTIVCLFVPWLVPVKPALSESFALGFSNHACFVAIIVVFIPFSFWYGRQLKVAPRDATKPDVSVLTKRFLQFAAASIVVQFLFLYLCRSSLFGYGEAEYFLVRLRLMENGLKPYVDFEFMYGPFFLYGLQILKRITGSTDTSAYLLILLLETVIGFWAVYWIVKTLVKKSEVSFIFACLTLPALSVFVAGQNYTYFRFAVPAALAIAAFKILRGHFYWGGIATSSVFLLSWLISPELALTSALALLITILVCANWKGRFITAASAFVGIGGVVQLIPEIQTSFSSLMSFAGGGNAFPLFPSPPIFISLFSIFFATRLLATMDVRRSPLFLVLYLFSVFNLASATGRSDPAHLAFNLFGLGILSAIYFEIALPKAKKLFALAAASMAFMIAIGTGYYYIPVSGALILETLRDDLNENQKAWLVERAPEKYREKVKGRLQAMDRAEDIRAHLGARLVQPRSDQLRPGSSDEFQFSYFPSPQAPMSASSIAKFATEIAESETLIMPIGLAENFCSPWNAHDRVLSLLLWFPVQLFSKRNEPNELRRPFCTAMSSFEEVFEQPGLYTVYKKRMPLVE